MLYFNFKTELTNDTQSIYLVNIFNAPPKQS